MGALQLSSPRLAKTQHKPSNWETLSNYQIPHVVCLDDDRTIGVTVQEYLTPHGYQVTALQSPLQAMTEMFQLAPDLILCDITMPKLDGYEFCRLVNHSQQLQKIPIVMLTGKDVYLDRLLAQMMGALDYLTKPFEEKELLSLVETYTKER